MVAPFSLRPSWEDGAKVFTHHQPNKGRGLGMCRGKQKGRLVNVPQSWIKEKQMKTQISQDFTFVETLILCSPYIPLLKTSFVAHSAEDYLACDRTVHLVNSLIQHALRRTFRQS